MKKKAIIFILAVILVISLTPAAAFAAGLAAGMAVAAAAVCAMYPDVSRRAVRDSKRMIKTGKRAIDRMCNW